ncbi:helix-turn-helix domain-containing protein [Stenotrophomonas indicatrix]|uniref:helix-turn-helix domain-containing protein n=1 Tax=Stenotrophomonas indicatrix TaxID=2045451 RepID=UPI00289C9C12|nr:helix-turn-helix transcriptional regulator [Stenotrophomonas indicatrix]
MIDLFPSRLRESRDRRGLTQSELGKEAGLPSTTISHFESGSRKPSFDNLRRLTKVLGVSTDYLMGLVDSTEDVAAATRIARHLGHATEDDIKMLEAVAKSLADTRKKDGQL